MGWVKWEILPGSGEPLNLPRKHKVDLSIALVLVNVMAMVIGRGHLRCCCFCCIRCLCCPRCLPTQNMRAEKRRITGFHKAIQTQPKLLRLKKLDSEAHLMTRTLAHSQISKIFQAGINVFSHSTLSLHISTSLSELSTGEKLCYCEQAPELAPMSQPPP